MKKLNQSTQFIIQLRINQKYSNYITEKTVYTIQKVTLIKIVMKIDNHRA